MKKETYYVIYVIFIYVIYMIFLYLEKKNIFKIKLYIKILIVITIIIDVVGGFYFKLYETTGWFDNVMHGLGGFSVTIFFNYVLGVKKISSSRILVFIFAWSVGIATGVFYELAEFALDIILKTKTQRGLVDTNLDLLFGTLGAMIGSVFIVYRKDI
jgi:hypothetical protein